MAAALSPQNYLGYVAHTELVYAECMAPPFWFYCSLPAGLAVGVAGEWTHVAFFSVSASLLNSIFSRYAYSKKRMQCFPYLFKLIFSSPHPSLPSLFLLMEKGCV